MSKTIHTQLQVSLLDKVSGPIKKVLASNRKLAAQIKRTESAWKRARGPVKLIEDFRKQDAALKKTMQAFRKAGEDAARLREKMTSVSRPTRKMIEDMSRLRRKLGETSLNPFFFRAGWLGRVDEFYPDESADESEH